MPSSTYGWLTDLLWRTYSSLRFGKALYIRQDFPDIGLALLQKMKLVVLLAALLCMIHGVQSVRSGLYYEYYFDDKSVKSKQKICIQTKSKYDLPKHHVRWINGVRSNTCYRKKDGSSKRKYCSERKNCSWRVVIQETGYKIYACYKSKTTPTLWEGEIPDYNSR